MVGNVWECAAMCSNLTQVNKVFEFLSFQMPGQSLIDLHVQIQKILNRLGSNIK